MGMLIAKRKRLHKWPFVVAFFVAMYPLGYAARFFPPWVAGTLLGALAIALVFVLGPAGPEVRDWLTGDDGDDDGILEAFVIYLLLCMALFWAEYTSVFILG